MALPEPEPQWPRPRPHRSPSQRFHHPAFADETADDIIHLPDLRQHPLGQRPEPQSMMPVVILLFLSFCASLWSWNNASDFHLAATQELVFQKGQYWRLFTTLLVHADIAHLLANSGLFLIFGLFLRNYFGIWAFPGLSLVGGILTGALALLTYPPQVKLIGASGMVYFMVALWLPLFFRYADYLSWTHRWMRAIAFALVVLVPTQFEPQVSYRTHAIGFALGLFFGWLSGPWMKPVTASTIQRREVDEEDFPINPVDREEDLLP